MRVRRQNERWSCDYLPFGEELFAGTGGRTTTQGYSVTDGVRQKFTSKERDTETGLDYFGARYYTSTQGRFTSPDIPFMDQFEFDPQSWNLYSYARNNPLRLVDPTGYAAEVPCDEICRQSRVEAERLRRETDAEGIDTIETTLDFCGSCGGGMVDDGSAEEGSEPPGTYRHDMYAGRWVRRTWSDGIWDAGKRLGMQDLTFWLGGALSRTPRLVFAARLGISASGLVRTTELIVTHGITKSRRAFKHLKASIAENGITEPIKYVEHNGQKYVVDGHHRLQAARELGIREIPAERVSLPFKGYKTVNDLLY